jgi:putative ATPase
MKQTSLFEKKQLDPKFKPLALRMAPKSLDDFMGQAKIVGEGKLLRRAIEADNLGSVIFFGPPGTGKSALARIIAATTKSHFEEANAVTIGIADIRKIIDAAKERLALTGKKTTLMLDEIHHFNKSQQDALLPDVEKGVITLIGITTENPFFYINAAIISRSIVFEFETLGKENLEKILFRALSDSQQGLGKYNVVIDDDAKEHLLSQSTGDARRLLNALEIGALSIKPDKDGKRLFTLEVAQESLQKRALRYDKSGDEHYDTISAFIKSMRGTDPDATVYWMAKMLSAGEDPRFIARRIIICASEDVGLADPRALQLAVSALHAVQFVGMPEARIILAQAAIYVACAPKSNASYLAISAALDEVKNGEVRRVPDHLKDANLDGEALGHGKGYKYPHDFAGSYVEQVYLPDWQEFYKPTNNGFEVKISEKLHGIRKKRSKV